MSLVSRPERERAALTADRKIQQYIQKLYHDQLALTKTSVSIGRNIAETPGEILLTGINKILSQVEMHIDDHFMDLGSGHGKIAAHLFLRTPLSKVTGIEIDAAQFSISNQICQRIKLDFPQLFDLNRDLHFMQGDFLLHPLNTATILLIASPCFTPAMLDHLAFVINRHASIHTVISLRPLIHLTRLTCKNIFSVECSWDTALCYLYQ